MRTRVGIGMVITATLALVSVWAATASAATWTVTDLKDDEVDGTLFGVSCPSDQLCVATGSDSLVATSTNPSGGRNAWRTFHPGGAADIEVVPGSAGAMATGWQIRGVSCPTTSLCIGVSLDDRVFSSTDPAGGAEAWKMIRRSGEKEPHTHMTGISCPSPSLCIAVAYGSRIVSSTNPTGGAPAWTEIELGDRFDFRGVSCPTVSFCAAVDNEGAIVTSTNPGGPPSAWRFVGRPGGLSSLNGIHCPSTALCVTGNAGQMITSTNPADAASIWKAVTAGTGLPVKGVSCPTPSTCAAVDNNSDAIVSTDPTGGTSAWSFVNVIPAPSTPGGSQNGMYGISCSSTSLCVGVGALEQIIVSRDPFASEPLVDSSRRSKRLRVVITHHPAKRLNPRKRGARAAFRFRATGRAIRYECKLRGRRFRTCKSPRRYRIGKGAYAFKVRAIAPGGVKGPPTTFHFRVGQLTEPQPVGSCRPNTPGLPPGVKLEPCVPGSWARLGGIARGRAMPEEGLEPPTRGL